MRFIRQLAKNIRAVLRDLDPAVVVNGVWDNLELETRVTDPKALKEMGERLTAPGIAHFLQIDEYPLGDFDDIVEKCKQHYGMCWPGRFLGALQACRQASVQLDGRRKIRRQQAASQCGAAGIDLKKPEIEVRIEVRDQRLFVIHSQHNGIGGYPLGALEQTLVLMSGGFDSTVAAYQIMRRGLMAHFCFFNLGGRAHELGVMEVAHFIWKKYGSSSACYLSVCRSRKWSAKFSAKSITVIWASY
jgi:thiamine biosynthesis protein ThiI